MIVGTAEGIQVLAIEGTPVGSLVGLVTTTVGASEGYLLGRSDGCELDAEEGTIVGIRVVGPGVGSCDGPRVEIIEGRYEGMMVGLLGL